MTTKHTPAPWTQGHSPAGITCVWLDGATEPLHEMGRCTSWIDCNTEANARLIAAAPELLQALIDVVRVADRATVEFDAARAAIAKATGKRK
ncbi:hypothetical protein [Bordetella trematum]|uniref:hypothetical protein n=1 Tax=Bordetella trematum TaxID=123899 RepID=UPI0012E74611|nr:hypothetical protein [Bordetella trematum]